MAETQSRPRLIRFGLFEADVQTGELRRDGLKLKFSGQPFQVLAILLERPGEMVTREELQKRLWPDTFVDVERNLNSAVNKIREVLGDSAESPRFVETLPRRGYRFICPVEAFDEGIVGLNGSLVPGRQNDNDADSHEAVTSGNGSRAEARRRARRRWMFLAAFASGLVLAVLLVGLLGSKRQSPGHYKFTHLASALGCGVMWSPDGGAIAYAREVNGTDQLFVRYLNSPVDIQLTHEPHMVIPQVWLPDGTHILFIEAADEVVSDRWKLLSVATVGGDPELIMPWTGVQVASSADGKALAIFTKGDRSEYGVQVSDPIGSPFKWYLPEPFKTKTVVNRPGLDFMPDGKALLLTYEDEKSGFHPWLLPYPAGSAPPEPSRLTLPKIVEFAWSWMPDHRHIVTPWAEEEGSPSHLWIWDTKSQERIQLTTGAAEDSLPRVSPDGSKVVFAQYIHQFDLTELSPVDGSATSLMSTGRDESMASWSSPNGKLAWVSNRNGPYEIWVRQPDGTQRPAITAADFPSGTSKFFMNPAISPDGDRIIYMRGDSSGAFRFWMSSLRGGVPIRLTNAEGSSSEWGGSWSPDGQRFVYMGSKDARNELMIVKTTGNAAPTKILDLNGWNQIPEWSLAGDWIACRNDEGWQLISPDGRSRKLLGKIETEYLAFSRDGKLLYGIQGGTKTDPHNLVLFSLDPQTLKIRNIKNLDAQFAPASPVSPGIRFSLSPDGKHFVYSTAKSQSDLWLMDGLRQPGWLSRLRDSIIR